MVSGGSLQSIQRPIEVAAAAVVRRRWLRRAGMRGSCRAAMTAAPDFHARTVMALLRVGVDRQSLGRLKKERCSLVHRRVRGQPGGPTLLLGERLDQRLDVLVADVDLGPGGFWKRDPSQWVVVGVVQ